MKTDTVIKNEGLKILREHLGMVDSERFIALIIREPFDYTKWRETLWDKLNVEEISKLAMEYRE